MRKNPQRLAVLCSDIHLTLQRPACRADDSWLEVQAGYLRQVKELAQGLPIVCAGDIFDRWNPTPELINFSLEYLPNGMICVPGQHDLPNHRLDLMEKSGYGVLRRAGKIVDISGKTHSVHNELICQGFAWGQEIEYGIDAPGEYVALAVVHKYIWAKGHSYPGAPEEANVSGVAKRLKGFNAAVFGDNHKGFLRLLKNGCSVFNAGGFIRRKSDESNYAPRVGVLYSDGSIHEFFLDTKLDVFVRVKAERPEIGLNMAEFIQDLENLGEHGLNFREAIEARLREDDIEKGTREIILKAIES